MSSKGSKTITVLPTDKPAFVYYCKAFKDTGKTVVVEYSDDDGKRQKINVHGVTYHGLNGDMIDGNSKGKAKASGARCVMEVRSGVIEIVESAE